MQQATAAPPSAANDNLQDTSNAALLDNVSEESVEMELPPPMCELQVLPTVTPTTTTTTTADTEEEQAEKEPSAHEAADLNRAPSTLNVATVCGGELQVIN